MTRGPSTDRNIGVLYVIRISVQITVANCMKRKRLVIGITVSSLSMSVEKRFTIRPRGVVSKKAMGALSILSNNLLWKRREAITPPVITQRDVPKVAITTIQNIQFTPRHNIQRPRRLSLQYRIYTPRHNIQRPRRPSLLNTKYVIHTSVITNRDHSGYHCTTQNIQFTPRHNSQIIQRPRRLSL